MNLQDLARLGAQIVGGQVDYQNKTIGKCLPGNKVIILDPDVEEKLLERLAELDAEADEPAAEPAPAPAPVARKAAAKKAAAPAAPPADTTQDELDQLLGKSE